MNEKLNAKDAGQYSSTENCRAERNTSERSERKPIIFLVNDILKYFVDEGLEPKEILMVLREVENEAMIALMMERLAQYTNEENEK